MALIECAFAQKRDCQYQAYWCEENVYHLIQNGAANFGFDLDHTFAVFISNEAKQVPLLRQQSSTYADGGVVWYVLAQWWLRRAYRGPG